MAVVTSPTTTMYTPRSKASKVDTLISPMTGTVHCRVLVGEEGPPERQPDHASRDCEYEADAHCGLRVEREGPAQSPSAPGEEHEKKRRRRDEATCEAATGHIVTYDQEIDREEHQRRHHCLGAGREER